jgi:multicomponent Na+:H+ antiporter subunit E
VTRRSTGVQGVALGAWFVLLWVLLWADLSVANVAGGAAVAAVAVVLARRISSPDREGAPHVSPIGTLVFAGHVLWSLVKSNLFLAWEIVTPTNTIEIGVVEVPLRSASPVIAMAVSNVVTLTPGSVTVGISDASLTIGVLHLHDPDEIRRDVQRTEQLAIRAFGCRAERRALAEEAS